MALPQAASYPFHDPVLTDRALVNPPSSMLRACWVAGALGGLFIVLYSPIGIAWKLSGLSGPGDAPLRVARGLGAAVLGNLPLFWSTDILKATTNSGTRVLGLTPPFLLRRWHRPAPLAFLLSLGAGLGTGVWVLVGHWPSDSKLGTGADGALLGQNLYGLVLCFSLYGLGLATDSLRRRSTALPARYFGPRLAEDG